MLHHRVLQINEVLSVIFDGCKFFAQQQVVKVNALFAFRAIINNFFYCSYYCGKNLVTKEECARYSVM